MANKRIVSGAVVLLGCAAAVWLILHRRGSDGAREGAATPAATAGPGSASGGGEIAAQAGAPSMTDSKPVARLEAGVLARARAEVTREVLFADGSKGLITPLHRTYGVEEPIGVVMHLVDKAGQPRSNFVGAEVIAVRADSTSGVRDQLVENISNTHGDYLGHLKLPVPAVATSSEVTLSFLMSSDGSVPPPDPVKITVARSPRLVGTASGRGTTAGLEVTIPVRDVGVDDTSMFVQAELHDASGTLLGVASAPASDPAVVLVFPRVFGRSDGLSLVDTVLVREGPSAQIVDMLLAPTLVTGIRYE